MMPTGRSSFVHRELIYESKSTCVYRGRRVSDGEDVIFNFRDSYGWDADQYWRTIPLGDVNGDGRDDLCGRGIAGVLCNVSLTGRFDTSLVVVAPAFSDSGGWTAERFYRTITLANTSLGVECSD